MVEEARVMLGKVGLDMCHFSVKFVLLRTRKDFESQKVPL